MTTAPSNDSGSHKLGLSGDNRIGVATEKHLLEARSGEPAPARFPSPFELVPHALARAAAVDLQSRLLDIAATEHDFFAAGGGKMFGVLVVQREKTTSADTDVPAISYLAAFSGMLAGEWLRPGFAPPVFSVTAREKILEHGEHQLQLMQKQIEDRLQSSEFVEAQQRLSQLQHQRSQQLTEARSAMQQRREQRHKRRRDIQQPLESSTESLLDALAIESQRDKSEYKSLQQRLSKQVAAAQANVDQLQQPITCIKARRKALSGTLQKRLFTDYQLHSYSGLSKPVTEFFGQALPPGGTGDCASIKLLQWCYALRLKPLCLAEFWWGASPPAGIRHHRHFYPACRGKCLPVLPHMLSGLAVDKPSYEVLRQFPASEPQTLYEDEHIIVLNKPAGLLSVAGRTIKDSVESRLQSRYPELVPGKLSRLLLHRLDQATSGLMVAAKDAASHKHLHQQFERRQITKAYIAVVRGRVANHCGSVELPLRVDLDDRPRQMVCPEHGKPAVTRYRVLSATDDQCRLQLTPVTGRTHQLRVHLAHPRGLNAPIIGDELYGEAADRLHLHAQRLQFTHPVTGEPLDFCAPAPF